MRSRRISISTTFILFSTVVLPMALVTIVFVFWQSLDDVERQMRLSAENTATLMGQMVTNGMVSSDYFEVQAAIKSATENNDILRVSVWNQYNELVASFEKRATNSVRSFSVKKNINWGEPQKVTVGKLAVIFSNRPIDALSDAFTRVSFAIFIVLFITAVMLVFVGQQIKKGVQGTIWGLERLVSRDATIDSRIPTFFSELATISEFIGRTSLIIEKARQQDSELAKQRAIAETTQMLAHDVRKPFSQLQMGLSLLKSVKSETEFRGFLTLTTESVNQALVSVNGLIEDVMEISRSVKPSTLPVEIESMVEKSLVEIFQVHQKCEIAITYMFSHERLVEVDQNKVLRVFSNILGNGIQAMKCVGNIMIATRSLTINGSSFAEIMLGNDGPVIPEESIPHLFESFYTSDKAGGTGLGLAIAKKVVEAHGGTICCISPGSQMPVEFRFTLPAGEQSAERHLQTTLPVSAKDYAAQIQISADTQIAETNPRLIPDPREGRFEQTVDLAVSTLKRKLYVAVIDDELIYRNAIVRLLSDNSNLENSVVILPFKSGTEALEDPVLQTTDAIICDVDLGYDSCNGYDVIRTLRSRNYLSHICVHSNRCLPEDFKLAMEAGADTVFPKPMSRSHLLQILVTAVESMTSAQKGTFDSNAASQAAEFPFRFAVIEDDRIVRSAWHEAFGDCVSIFPSAEDLLGDGTIMEQVRDALSPFDFIVTDFHLDEKGPIPTGAMVATIVQRFHPMPVFLCSSVDWEEPLHSKLFSGHLSKFDDFRQKTQELVERAGLQPRGQSGAKRQAPSRAKPLAQVSQSKQPDGKYTLEQLARLRHDIRNHLANVQIIASRLSYAHSKDFAEDARLGLSALAELDACCDEGLVSKLRQRLQALASLPKTEINHADLIAEIVELAQELTLAHHTDPAWVDLETNPLFRNHSSEHS